MKTLGAPTLAEDLLLVLFRPDAGTIAGEHTLDRALAGAVLAELALNGSVTIMTTGNGFARVEAVEGRAPSDPILRPAWDRLSDAPGGVRTALAAIGPTLRQPLLERRVARGDLRERNGKVLGRLKTVTLEDGESGRRSGLVQGVRGVLVDGGAPTPRLAALAALLWASGTLHQFDPEIPWTSAVATRAQELARGVWSAEGATRSASSAPAATIGAITASVLHIDDGLG